MKEKFEKGMITCWDPPLGWRPTPIYVSFLLDREGVNSNKFLVFFFESADDDWYHAGCNLNEVINDEYIEDNMFVD